MAGEIHKMQKNGVVIYPATTTDAVVEPTSRMNIGTLIKNQKKYLSVTTDNISVSLNSNGLTLVINSGAFLFLKDNKYNRLTYIKVPSCNITISGDKVIAFSDTENTYTPCTYGSTIYIVEALRSVVSYIDVIVGLNSQQVYSDYPIIMSALYKNISDLRITSTEAKIEDVEAKIEGVQTSVDELTQNIAGLEFNNWAWSGITETAVSTSGVVIPKAIKKSTYISFDVYTLDASVMTISLYTKSDNVFTKYKDLYTFKPDTKNQISSHTIPDKIDIEEQELYLGISTGSVGYINSAKPEGEFRLLANNGTYYGLCFTFYAAGELINSINTIEKKQSEMDKEFDTLSEKVESLAPSFTELYDNEYWVQVQGNIFALEDFYLSGNSEILEGNTISIPDSSSYIALNKPYWSNRRIHKFNVTLTELGSLIINMAQNTSNVLFPTFSGGNWTSKFKIDFLNRKVYMANDLSFDIDLAFEAGRKYTIELKYIKRIFTVTIVDFLTNQKSSVTLDARERNINGGFKNTLVILNESGNYIVDKIETYEVANPLVVIFGDSVSEAIGRVGQGENYSEIISEEIKSCSIIAQGGAGAGYWEQVFENEIKYIKPKYCSYHMAINGGVSEQQLEKFVSDCQSIGTIPIINNCISTASYSSDNSDKTWNAVIDKFCSINGFKGYHGNIATAQNNNIISTPNFIASSIDGGSKWGIKKCSMALECFPTRKLSAGTIVVEDGEERVLDSELTVVTDIHPSASGHKKMAERYLEEIRLI